jgi:hypothetical protein
MDGKRFLTVVNTGRSNITTVLTVCEMRICARQKNELHVLAFPGATA